jgi:hypothetical protein
VRETGKRRKSTSSHAPSVEKLSDKSSKNDHIKSDKEMLKAIGICAEKIEALAAIEHTRELRESMEEVKSSIAKSRSDLAAAEVSLRSLLGFW